MTLSKRDRGALLFGAVATATLFVAGRGVPALAHWEQEARSEAAALADELSRATVLAAAWPAVRDSLAVRSARFVELAPLLLEGNSPAAAQTALATHVALAAERAPAELGSVRFRVDSAASGYFARVAVSGDLVADIHGLLRFVTTLEQGPPLLAIDQVSVDQPDPAAAGDQVEALRVTFTASGLVPRESGARAP